MTWTHEHFKTTYEKMKERKSDLTLAEFAAAMIESVGVEQRPDMARAIGAWILTQRKPKTDVRGDDLGNSPYMTDDEETSKAWKASAKRAK